MKMDYETLYRRIGFLFYAEAARRKRLTSSDYEKLENIVKEKWPAENGDPKWIHLVDELFLAVKDAYRESMQAGEASQLFKLYYASHAIAFSESLKNKIVATSQEIEREFAVNGNHNGGVNALALERLFQTKTELQ
ncbi:MAG TPA: hypothetical protein VIU12_27450 [Chryseolinea sp.]